MAKLLILAVVTLAAMSILSSNAHPATLVGCHEGTEDQPPNNIKICLTKSCIKVASKLIEIMDEKVDPCEDFYEFACGGFKQNTIIPPDRPYINFGSILEDKLRIKKKNMLEAKNDPTEPKIFQSLRDLYKSCMEVKEIEKNSVDELNNILYLVGGFPVVEGDKWNETGYNSYDLDLKLVHLGLQGKMFTNIDFLLDAKNTTRWLLSIDEAFDDESLSRENLVKGLKDSKVEAYLKYLIETAKFLGASDETAEKEMNDVLNLMIDIAKIMKPQEYWRNATAEYNLMTLKDVSMLYPGVPWVDLFNKYLDIEFKHVKVNENSKVVVKSPSYLEDIQILLGNTSSRVQANFQISQAIPMSILTEGAWKIKDEFDKVAYGIEVRETRWLYCVDYISEFKVATSAMYVGNYFSIESKKMASKIVQNVLDEFDNTLDELDWMDQETRKNAHEKLHSIHSNIGYPEEILNKTLVDEYYADLILSPTGFFENNLNVTKYFFKKECAKYQKPVRKNDWTENAETDNVNAWYDPQENIMTFTAAILSGIFFDPDRPLYMNYGATAITVGHELIHAFDDEGSQFDAHGNMVDWCDPATKQIYLERTQCVIEAYGNYTIMVEGEEFHLNGVNIQGENIADIDGVKHAYKAYQRIADNFTEPEALLPGLHYTQNQLFWVASALDYCAAERPEVVKNGILNDPHTPSKFRVNGPLFHLEEFARVWNCPYGSKMNPPKKCNIW